MALQNINIALELWGILIAILALIGVGFNFKIDKTQSWLLIGMCIIGIINLLAGLLHEIYKAGEGQAINTLLSLCSFFELLCTYGFILILTVMMFVSIEKSGDTTRGKKIIIFIYGTIMFSTIIMSMTDTYAIVGTDNIVRRGDLYWLTRIIGIALIVINFLYLLIAGRKLKRQEQLILVFYMALIALALIIQIYVAEINIFDVAMVLDIMIMFMVMIKTQVEIFYNQRKMLADMKMNLMLSQMRPHFLYNTLTSIAYFCDEDPKTAKNMTIMFADYLRKSMDDLESSEEVPFETELKHVETYLSIEKARFGDILQVEYDIQARDFKMPTLTLQPMVENAVKHGIRAKEDGGTVRIATRETENEYVITVSDDGEGFDLKNEFSGDRRHIGIRNVRERLASVSCATLDIESEKGVGTKVTIAIPKEDEK